MEKENHNNFNQSFTCAICGLNMNILNKEEHLSLHCLEDEGKYIDDLNNEEILSNELISISTNIQANYNFHEQIVESSESYYNESEFTFSYNYSYHDELNNRNVVDEMINNLEVNVINEDFGKFSGKICIICQDYFKIGEKYINLPCTHFFHEHCIKRWIKTKNICPLCKSELKLDK